MDRKKNYVYSRPFLHTSFPYRVLVCVFFATLTKCIYVTPAANTQRNSTACQCGPRPLQGLNVIFSHTIHMLKKRGSCSYDPTAALVLNMGIKR